MFASAKPEQKKTAKNTVQKKELGKSAVTPNQTGIPDDLKTRFEHFSGFSFADVRVHYNSDKPAQLQALAYTQGNQVYVAPGQEKHLGHELGHVVQQKEKKVKPTGIIGGAPINDDLTLERSADRLAANVTQFKNNLHAHKSAPSAASIIQRQASECTRPLGGGGDVVAGQPPVPAYADLPIDDRNIRNNLKIEHRHIIFDQPQAGLPPHLGAANDNIGFHSATGGVRGPGELFSEQNLGQYAKRRIISNTPAEDANLVTAINAVGVNGRFARYNLITTNCQDWVDAVIINYNAQGNGAPNPLRPRGIFAR